ncbi:MAG: hypothetical protein DCC68_22695 [Planctomycetota bacterium]|nr:MAG: hypothetical protein DCC68_22695 [Planctomycetota bacterium]
MNLKLSIMTLAFIAAGLMLSMAAFAQEKENSLDGDALLIAAQKICPVSGGDLRAMGGPIKAKSGDQTVFLCCKECLGKPISKENWAQVTVNLTAAQGRCPVMNRPLPQGAKSVVVNGRRVFVCCPPCIGKIQANPDRFLAVVNAMLAKNVGQLRAE